MQEKSYLDPFLLASYYHFIVTYYRELRLNGGSQELEKLNLHEAKKAFLRYKDLYKNGGKSDR